MADATLISTPVKVSKAPPLGVKSYLFPSKKGGEIALPTCVHCHVAKSTLFGYSAAEALGQKLDLIIPEHLRGAHWRGFEAAMTHGVMKLQGRPTLTRATHQTGRRLYVEMTFALVKGQAGGAAHGAVAVAREVTRRIEEQRADAHAMDAAKRESDLDQVALT